MRVRVLTRNLLETFLWRKNNATNGREKERNFISHEL